MTETLELHFCDLCGVSIPLKDLETGLARTLDGKRIGACCLSRLAPPAPPATTSTARSPAGAWFPAVVTVAAIAAAAWDLDERGRERTPTTSIEALGGRVEALRELAVRLDEKLAKQSEATARSVLAAQAPALAALAAELAKLQASKSEPDRAAEAMKERITLLATQLVDMADRQRAIESQMSKLAQTLHDGLGQVDQSLTDLRRQGMAAAPPPSDAAPAARPAVPEALGRKVDQLANENPGIRWAAVDEMIRAGDKAAVPFLVPLLKDKDLFVRRLVAEGLATLGDEQVCGSLIDALDDGEAIVREAAHKALVKLSGRKITFDAEAAPDVRQAAVVKWRQWWSEREKAAKTRG
jgi:hypothetical protein